MPGSGADVVEWLMGSECDVFPQLSEVRRGVGLHGKDREKIRHARARQIPPSKLQARRRRWVSSPGLPRTCRLAISAALHGIKYSDMGAKAKRAVKGDSAVIFIASSMRAAFSVGPEK
eukprot:6851620-Pyramimonas_sp.AAC.1